MKAVTFHAIGGPEVLAYEDVPDPVPGPGQALVRVKACALNHLDLIVQARPGVPLPHITGCDAAGVVAGLGPGTDGPGEGVEVILNPALSCGRCRYCLAGEQSLCRAFGILGRDARGAMAEYVVVPVGNLHARPGNLSFTEAAAVPLVFLTAWRMLMTRARLLPGERVLVVGAGGGVATAAIQIARLAGATVYASTGGPAKVVRACEMGADVAIDYTTTNVAEAILDLTNGEGVDVVVDSVGAATWEGSLGVLARGGRLVTCGATAGHLTTVDMRSLWRKQISLLGSTMGNAREFREVLDLVAAGKLLPVVDRVYPLSAAAEAEAYLAAAGQFGKVVLEV